MRGHLFERAGELDRIGALLAAAKGGSGGVLVFTGPMGIGKTALIQATQEDARLAGLRVLSARGAELERDFSFGLARQLFEPLLAAATTAERDALFAGAARRVLSAIHDAAGPEPSAAGADAPFAMVHGLYWLTVNASEAAGVLLAVDDLQWADQASLRFLLYLADRLDGLPVALVASWRAGEAGGVDYLARLEQAGGVDYLARLEQAGGVDYLARLEQAAGDVLSPAALSQAAVRDLLSEISEAPPSEAFTQACHSVTGGNPFLLRELTEDLCAEGIDPAKAATDRVTQLGPRSVARVVMARVARLGPMAGRLAQAAAVLGDGAALRHAAVLAGTGLAEAAAAADELASIGVFEPGTPLRFVHPMVRTAVHDDIPVAARGLRHAAAARLLASEGADVDAVCAHVLVCEPVGSLEVVTQLRTAAARAVRRGAPESAVTYLTRALAETADVNSRSALLHELGMAEKMLVDPTAAEHLRESLELADAPARRAAIAPDLAELLVLAGQWDAGAAVVDSALEDLGGADWRVQSDAGASVARLQTWWAAIAAHDPDRVGEFDQRLDELIVSALEPAAESHMLAAVLAGTLAWRGERFDTARALLHQAIHEDRTLFLFGSAPLLVAHALFATLWLDELPLADEIIRQLLDLSRSRGWALGPWVTAWIGTAVRARHGDLVGAETDVRVALEVATDPVAAFGIPSALCFGIDALTERPELSDVAVFATGVELDSGLERTASGAMLREVRGRLALAAGDFGAARAELAAAADIYEALRLRSLGSGWRSALALATAAEDPGEALRLAGDDLADAQRAGSARATGIALRTLGMLKRGRDGLRDLREAVEVLGGADARLEHARALVELGGALRRGNQRAAAREPLRMGLDGAYRCGAGRLAQRAASELRATGARPRRAVLTGLEALTASERRVAELAAGRMSNPEIAQALFVTLSTVEGHLHKVYQKLLISQRSQLPAALQSAAPGTSMPLR